MVTTENFLNLSTIIHLISHAILFTWFFMIILQSWVKSKQYRIVIALGLFVCAFIPLNETSSIEYLRGFFGNLSIVTTLLLIDTLYKTLSGQTSYAFQDRHTLNYLIVIAGLFLYPFTLGLSLYDPYQFGYQPIIFGAILLLVALLSWWQEKYFTLIAVLFAVGCFSLSLGESRNLWDYLIDPLLFLYAFFWLTLQQLKKWTQISSINLGQTK